MESVEAALRIVLEHARPRSACDAPLSESAGRTLAEEIVSDLDLPPFPKAMMDGFAVRSQDCTDAGRVLVVVEEITAGHLPSLPLAEGQASRINTGAALPEGSDAVVMIERCELLEGDRVRVGTAVAAGQHVQPVGRELRRGDKVLSPGIVLNPAHAGLLATVGRSLVRVSPRPRVVVLATGDELVTLDQQPGPGQIRNSNGPMLAAQALSAGAIVLEFGIGADDPSDLLRQAGDALEQADVVLICGGVSAGQRDLVPGVLAQLGVEVHFHRVALKPGKPLLFGTRGATLVFGLPGNPVSSFVGFELFVRPALGRVCGRVGTIRPTLRLPLAEEFSIRGDRPTYHPARIEPAEVGEVVRPVPWHGSADLLGLCAADALAVFPAGEHRFPAGSPVSVHRLPVA